MITGMNGDAMDLPFPSDDEVLGQWCDFKASWWEKYVPVELWPSGLTGLPSSTDRPGYQRINRQDVFALAADNTPQGRVGLLPGGRQSRYARPRVISGNSGVRACSRSPAAMFVWPVRRRALIARVRRAATLVGPFLVRIWLRSSLKATSRTQCRAASMAQCPRTQQASSAGSACRVSRLVIA